MHSKTGFLSLPFELRIKIYRDLLCPSKLDFILLSNDSTGTRRSDIHHGIALVNRQISAEAIRVLNYENIWVRVKIPAIYAQDFCRHTHCDDVRLGARCPSDMFIWPPVLDITTSTPEGRKLVSYLFSGFALPKLYRYMMKFLDFQGTLEYAHPWYNHQLVDYFRIDMRQLGHLTPRILNELTDCVKNLRGVADVLILGLDGTPIRCGLLEMIEDEAPTPALIKAAKSLRKRALQLLEAGKRQDAICLMDEGVQLSSFIRALDPSDVRGFHEAVRDIECDLGFPYAGSLLEIGAADAAATVILTLLTNHAGYGFTDEQKYSAYYQFGIALARLDENDAAAYSFAVALDASNGNDTHVEEALHELERKVKGRRDEVIFNIGVLGPLRHLPEGVTSSFSIQELLARFQLNKFKTRAKNHHQKMGVDCIWERYRKGDHGLSGFSKVFQQS